MFVKRIVDFDESSGEMDLIVSDHQNELLCYCAQSDAPSAFTIKRIETFLATDIMIVDEKKHLIKKENDYYAYRLQGKVLQTMPPAMEIGKIYIFIDSPLPQDIQKDDFIELFVQRLDCSLS